MTSEWGTGCAPRGEPRRPLRSLRLGGELWVEPRGQIWRRRRTRAPGAPLQLQHLPGCAVALSREMLADALHPSPECHGTKATPFPLGCPPSCGSLRPRSPPQCRHGDLQGFHPHGPPWRCLVSAGPPENPRKRTSEPALGKGAPLTSRLPESWALLLGDLRENLCVFESPSFSQSPTLLGLPWFPVQRALSSNG